MAEKKTVEELIGKLDEKEKKRSRKNKGGKGGKKPFIYLGLALLILFVLYIAIGEVKYKGKFLPNTVINGTDFSGMTAKEVESYYQKVANNYKLDITKGGSVVDTLLASDFDFVVTGSAVEKINEKIDLQPNYKWLSAILGEKDEYEINNILWYDEGKLKNFIVNSKGYNMPTTRKSKQGTIYYNGENFQVIPPVVSDEIEPLKYINAVKGKVDTLQRVMNVEEENCYAKYDFNDEIKQKLEKACEDAYKFFNEKEFNIKLKNNEDYDFRKEVINYAYNIDYKYDFICNEKTISSGVEALSKIHNTMGKEIEFETSHGTKVKVKGGDYGTKINSKELEMYMKKAFIEKEDVNCVIDYKKNTLGDSIGIGDTYVEIDLTNQYLYMYVDGKLVKKAPVVTGLPGSRATPQGVYRMKNRLTDVPLVGDNYVTPVKYWMAFNGGIGIHDAVWQRYFGGEYYKKKGSHGCVNMAMSDAKDVYENAIVNMPVICYYHERLPEFKEVKSSGPIMAQYRPLTPRERAIRNSL